MWYKLIEVDFNNPQFA